MTFKTERQINFLKYHIVFDSRAVCLVKSCFIGCFDGHR